MAQSRVLRGDRRGYWQGLIEQWERDGGTQEAFCAARGVAVSTFRWWRWKLGVAGAVPPRPRRSRRVASPARASSAFVPVRIVERQQANVATPVDGGFELTLAGGMRVRVPGDFEAESLARLLAVLGGRLAC